VASNREDKITAGIEWILRCFKFKILFFVKLCPKTSATEISGICRLFSRIYTQVCLNLVSFFPRVSAFGSLQEPLGNA
jgi:hypothetical protein